MVRLSMLIDTHTCIGCLSCTVACKVQNGSPPGMWFAPVVQRELGRYPAVRRLFLPLLCMHCEEPACAEACPSGAISRRRDGIVVISQDRCCGSRACVLACPHGALRFYEKPRYYYDLPTPLEELKLASLQPGTAQKCDLCAPRVDMGLAPACVEACPTDSRLFGDLDDADSDISRRAEMEESTSLRAGSFTVPSVRYSTRGIKAAGGGEDATALPYRLQRVWDLPHAIEFWLLGAGAGLHLASLLLALDSALWGVSLPRLLAVALVALGGVVLIADLGRPARFPMAFRNQRSSWLSRGAAADFVFIGALLVLSVFQGDQNRALWAALATVGALAAVVVATYPALAMGSFRSVPAWSGAFLPLEFQAESAASGIAIVALLRPEGTVGTATTWWMLALALVRLGLFERRNRLLGRSEASLAPGLHSLLRGDAAGFHHWGVLVAGVLGTVAFSTGALLFGRPAASWLAALAAVTTLMGTVSGKVVALRTGALPLAENPRPSAGGIYA